MTNNELNKTRKALETRVAELDRSTRRRDVICIDQHADALDRRLSATEREFAVRDLESGSARLREARQALKRLDDGTYGTCVECEEPVSAARLAALPWAALCIRCQEAVDCRCGTSDVRPTLSLAA